MRKVIKIWGRKLKLNIDMDCIDDEVVTPIQEETLSAFLDEKTIIDETLLNVKRYVLEEDELKDQDSIENIFKYVVPKTIFVPREDKKKTVAILCDYYFDQEHGIAIVFEDGKFKRITSQDEVI